MSDPSSAQPSSQWQRLLKNAGTWEGSFTQFSPDGKVLSNVRTEVELTPTNDQKSMHQEVRRYPPEQTPSIQAFDYSSLNRATAFFENGAFSQGSIQWAPFSTFGAELGLIAGEERVRLVALYDDKGALKPITLIRETLRGSTANQRPAFCPDDLVGTWQGECITLYADGQPETQSTYQQTISKTQDNQIHEPTWVINGTDQQSSLGAIKEQSIDFYTGSTQTSRLLMLPDGCFCGCPLEANPREKTLFVELGWMVKDRSRQRIRRVYDANGAWEKLILFIEQRTD